MNNFVVLVSTNLPPSAQSSSQSGQPAQGRRKIKWKALAHFFPSSMCRSESTPSNIKTLGKQSRRICFLSAEHSNLSRQPREREEVQPTHQCGRQSWTPYCRKFYQSQCTTTYFTDMWIVSLGERTILSSISSNMHSNMPKKAQKAHAILLTNGK